jgi:signal transduction histidine kinase
MSSTGILRLRLGHKQKLIDPKIFITRIHSATKEYNPNVNTGTGNEFNYQENNLTFEFSSTSYRKEDLVKYSYRISNENDSGVWSVASNKHEVALSSLAPGHYLFSVKAESVDELWSNIPAQYQFIITPPFWKTAWFQALAILAFLGLGYAFVRFRLNQLAKMFNIRAKISRDLHDEIGSTLSGVNLYSEWAKSQLHENKIDSASVSLEKMIETSGEMLRKMNDIVWAINPQYDTFEQLYLRLKAFAALNAAPKGIELNFEIDDALQHQKTDLSLRENIYFICREAIHNSIKYSGAKNLCLKLEQTRRWIIINIWDDGTGFDLKNVSATKNYQAGNGLGNMQTREREMKAKLNIESGKGSGTAIRLEVPFT